MLEASLNPKLKPCRQGSSTEAGLAAFLARSRFVTSTAKPEDTSILKPYLPAHRSPEKFRFSKRRLNPEVLTKS